jgi:hypothetical protein
MPTDFVSPIAIAEILSMEGAAAVSTRIGRRGDPRMHRAVAARMANPRLSLFQALHIGGFEYSNDDDPNQLDSEQITLIQRKNQLSRRIRYALRQQGTPEGVPDEWEASKPDEPQSPSKKRRNMFSVDMTELESIIEWEIQKTMEVGSTNSIGVEEHSHDWRSTTCIPEQKPLIDLPPSDVSPNGTPLEVSSLHPTAASMNLEQMVMSLSRKKRDLGTILQSHNPTKSKSSQLLNQIALPDEKDMDTANNSEAVQVHQHLQAAVSAWEQEGQRLRQLIAQCKEQGRTPILHQPNGYGKPHIDFLVDHCVECYSGILPQITTDNGEERNGDLPNAHLFADSIDPIIYDQNIIDWESDEWDFDLLRSDSLANLLVGQDFESPTAAGEN